jgi:hypothetical protein
MVREKLGCAVDLLGHGTAHRLCLAHERPPTASASPQAQGQCTKTQQHSHPGSMPKPSPKARRLALFDEPYLVARACLQDQRGQMSMISFGEPAVVKDGGDAMGCDRTRAQMDAGDEVAPAG